jgi:hypothetical protein
LPQLGVFAVAGCAVFGFGRLAITVVTLLQQQQLVLPPGKLLLLGLLQQRLLLLLLLQLLPRLVNGNFLRRQLRRLCNIFFVNNRPGLKTTDCFTYKNLFTLVCFENAAWVVHI